MKNIQLGVFLFPSFSLYRGRSEFFNTFSFPNDKKVDGGWVRSSLGLGNTQLVSRTYVYSHQTVRVHRLEDQPYLFNIYLVWTNDILPLNFTLLTCVMGILPRRVGKLCERTPGDMCHKMLSMQTYYKELGEHTPLQLPGFLSPLAASFYPDRPMEEMHWPQRQ